MGDVMAGQALLDLPGLPPAPAAPTPWTLGVDPGATGALALLDPLGALVAVWDMPMVEKDVAAPLVADIATAALDASDTHLAAWVERAQAMPGQGVSGVFRYGRGYGVVLGVLGARHIPTHHITPTVWKRAAGLSSDKGASRRRAIDMWPSHAALFARVKDDGRAEGALIARHGWQTMRAEVAA